jgi:type IV secretory pathway TraG/TraD family ATPase VirD4
MRNVIKSPSEPYQNWVGMASSSLVLGAVTSLGAIYTTWSWHTPWPDITQHLELIKSLIIHNNFDLQSTWQTYKTYLTSNKWFDDFLLHLSIPALSSFYVSSLFCVQLFYIEDGRTLERHIRGIKKLVGRAAKKHAKQQLSIERSLGAKKGLLLHPDVQISQQAEIGNIFISGKPGSGKTVIILYLLQQIIHRTARFLIFDAKAEMTEKLYQKENTTLIAPWDNRSVVWNIALDLASQGAPENFAKHVIPETNDAIWSQASRIIFTGMIISLQKQNSLWGWKELYELLILDDAKLRKILLKHYPAAIRFVEENNKTTQSILMTLQSTLAWIKWLAIAWPKSYQSTFSVLDWVHNSPDKPRLIIQGNKRYADVGGPLCQVIMSMMADEHLLMDKPFPCYWILDELAHLPKSSSLLQWLELARERGGRSIIGLQTLSSLEARGYSRAEIDAMVSMFTNQVALKSGSIGETTNKIAKSLGERVIAIPQYTQENGVQIIASYQEQTLPTIPDFDLTELPDPNDAGVQGYLSINGRNATYKLQWSYPKLYDIAEKWLPSEWTLETQIKSKSKSKIRTRICQRRES